MDTSKTNDIAVDAADREAQERAPNPPVETSADVAAERGETGPASAAGKVPDEAGSQGGEAQADLPDLPQASPLSDETAPAAPEGQPDGENEAGAPEIQDADPDEFDRQLVEAVEAEERHHAEAMKNSVLSGAAHQPGTTLEVSDEEAMHYLRQMAIDDMGRIWRIEENGDMLRVKMVGTLVR